MANISVTNTFSNSTTADATQVNQNFSDIINGTSDGTKDFSISALTVGGTLTANGNVNIGNASSDDLTVTASLASSLAIKTTFSYDIGSATLGLRYAFFGSNDSAAKSVKVAAGVVGTSYTLTLPTTAGSAGQATVTDGSGGLSWSYGLVPVGSIIPWIGGYFTNSSNGSFTNVLANTVANVNTLLNSSGYYVCDGSALNLAASSIFNGASRYLPNLTDSRFLMGSTAAGSTGGSNTMAHTHSVTSNVSVSNHSDHTHSSGTFQSAVSYSSSHIRFKVNATTGFTADYKVTATGISGSSDSTSVSDAVDVQGDSGGSNSTLTHSVTNNSVTSGAASNDENRPLYLSVFFIMRVI